MLTLVLGLYGLKGIFSHTYLNHVPLSSHFFRNSFHFRGVAPICSTYIPLSQICILRTRIVGQCTTTALSESSYPVRAIFVRTPLNWCCCYSWIQLDKGSRLVVWSTKIQPNFFSFLPPAFRPIMAHKISRYTTMMICLWSPKAKV